MSETTTESITLYTSNWCSHSMSVEGFLEKHHVQVNMINIDGNEAAREALIALNGGYASVPTLLFPDGSKLTEPSIGALRQKLGIEPPPGLIDRLRGLMSQKSEGA